MAECKGLEADDVLLYNFFADSDTQTEWRALVFFLNAIQQQRDTDFPFPTDIPITGAQARALDFKSDQHRLLESELKILYTGLTRAKKRVWIFDAGIPTKRMAQMEAGALAGGSGAALMSGSEASELPRTAVFAFFQRQGLVDCIVRGSERMDKQGRTVTGVRLEGFARPSSDAEHLDAAQALKAEAERLREPGLYRSAATNFASIRHNSEQEECLGHACALDAATKTGAEAARYQLAAATHLATALSLAASAPSPSSRSLQSLADSAGRCAQATILQLRTAGSADPSYSLSTRLQHVMRQLQTYLQQTTAPAGSSSGL